MSEIVTGTVTGQVNDGPILRDIGTVRREAAINEGVTSMNIKDGTDTVKDQAVAFFVATQNNAFQTATALAALTASTNAAFTATQVAIELAQANNAAATALASSATNSLITAEATKISNLIRDQKIEDLRFAALKRDHDGGHRGCGCKGPKFTFGPPLSATVETAGEPLTD